MWIKIAGRYINLNNVKFTSVNDSQIYFYFGIPPREDKLLVFTKGSNITEQEFERLKKSLEEKLSI